MKARVPIVLHIEPHEVFHLLVLREYTVGKLMNRIRDRFFKDKSLRGQSLILFFDSKLFPVTTTLSEIHNDLGQPQHLEVCVKKEHSFG